MTKPTVQVPRFFLFGEPPRDAAATFVHVETIAQRSRVQGWTIRPHAHRDLHQILLVRQGAGALTLDGETRSFEPPALLVVSAGSAHGFRFAPETDGFVLTLASDLVAELGRHDPAFRALFARSLGMARPEADQADEIARDLAALSKDLVWWGPAARGAIDGRVMTILAETVRALAATSDLPASRPSSRAVLVARFRAVIEARFREDWALPRYAAALGVTVGQLRAACAEVAGNAPLALVHDRRILEAKRALAYTSASAAEIAYDLGLDDPAYFSRFFARRVGEPPAAYRRRVRDQRP